MQISTQVMDRRITVFVTGEIDLQAGHDLTANLTTLLGHGYPIDIDASGIDFMDSAALLALQGLLCEAAGRGVAVTLISQSQAVDRIVGLTGLGTWTRARAGAPPA